MKKATILILLFIMLTTSTIAATTTNPVTNTDNSDRVNLQEIEQKQLVIEQHAKTQAFFRTELAKRDAQLQKDVQEYVDDNFMVLDERINDFTRKATFKLGMTFFSATILAGCLLILINNQIRRKRAIKKNLTGINEKLILSGTTLNKVKENTDYEPTKDPELERMKKELSELQEQLKNKKVVGRPRKEELKEVPETLSELTIKPMGETL